MIWSICKLRALYYYLRVVFLSLNAAHTVNIYQQNVIGVLRKKAKNVSRAEGDIIRK